MKFLAHWAMSTVAVWVAVRLIPGLYVDGGLFNYLVISLVLGFINATLGPVIKLFSLPLIVLTMGLFLIVINGLMLALTAALLPYFTIDGFLPALVGSVMISIVGWFLRFAIGNRFV